MGIIIGILVVGAFWLGRFIGYKKGFSEAADASLNAFRRYVKYHEENPNGSIRDFLTESIGELEA